MQRPAFTLPMEGCQVCEQTSCYALCVMLLICGAHSVHLLLTLSLYVQR